ncbi:MAG: type II toxin-antitoxin system ParD family antitoxin [Xenococcus sp. MO_188.B8]|nr:type II toxin-antitoxin system ParD family antitoxin [Xenococcus sp. MO_188.B8]
MTTLNISLPDSMRAFIDEQITQGGYSTASEYIRDLIRQAQKQAAQENLDSLLLEGLASGKSIEVTDEWWQEKQERLIKLRRKQG